MKGENQDVQYKNGREHPASQAGRGPSAYLKRIDNAGLENLGLYQELRRALPRRQSRWLDSYLLDVLAEAMNPISWRKMLGEAHRRVSIYYPDDSQR